jgi:type IV pilus assembly protein PilM
LEAQFVATQSILRDAISRGQPVVTCLCDPGIIIRQITLPIMTQRDLERAIPFEARKHFPYDHSRVMFHYQVVNEGPRTQIRDVLLVAIPREPLKRHEELLKRLGVEPYAIEIGPLALANAYLLAQRKSRETIVLLDLGASGTLIDIHRAEGTFFYRRLPISGGRLTREIMKGLDVPREVAERLKQGERLNGESELSQVQDALLPVMELLLMEIRRSLAYYDNVTGRLGFSRLFLTGGGALLPGLKEFLEEKLELPVEVMDPLGAVDWDDAHFARGWMERTRPLWALAVALATRL